MIKVTFTDGKTLTYSVGCRQLHCSTWDDVDYKWAFKPIADLINADINTIESWRVA